MKQVVSKTVVIKPSHGLLLTQVFSTAKIVLIVGLSAGSATALHRVTIADKISTQNLSAAGSTTGTTTPSVHSHLIPKAAARIQPVTNHKSENATMNNMNTTTTITVDGQTTQTAGNTNLDQSYTTSNGNHISVSSQNSSSSSDTSSNTSVKNTGNDNYSQMNSSITVQNSSM